MHSRPRILVTRSPHQASELADRLRALGFEPVLIPAIETVEPTSFAALDAALRELIPSENQRGFDWLLFTSANAVEAFHRRLQHRPAPFTPEAQILKNVISTDRQSAEWKDPQHTPADPPTPTPDLGDTRVPRNLRVAAIGPATRRALEGIGLPPDLIPPQAVAESLVEALLPLARQPDGTPTRFLLIRAEEAREHLPEVLRAAGAEVAVAPAYRTVIPEGSVRAIRDLFAHDTDAVRSSDPLPPPIDAITFTSSSTARNLLSLCEAASVTLPQSTLRISIGPITSQTLRELGLRPHAESPEATVAALAETVVNTLRGHQSA